MNHSAPWYKIAATVVILMAVANPGGADTPVLGLGEEPVLLNKPDRHITDAARSFLSDRDGSGLKVWVFFTDKGVTDRPGFQQAAAAVSLTERSARRRAKVDRDRVLFVDLPVVQQYVDQIVSLGAELRRKSRWLNAASFEVPSDRLDEVGALDFVAFIKPVAMYKTAEPVEFQELRSPGGTEALAPDALSYGGSLAQLQQIHVPAVHAMGYSGSGVTLAIMDTGYRKTHEAFAQHYADGRVLAEWDFIFDDGNTANETEDVLNQWNHGTLIWSVSGGHKDGSIYGPAYAASFILCKTEDLRSETPVEEDNWIAALEFSDSIGTDVITTSLTYSDWYTYEDFDGQTATITLAANTCDSLGIIFCNSMGNSGPNPGTLGAPADAFGILACGAVDSQGLLAGFSSRGPTADGRIKPEVCARGVSTYAGTASGDDTYGGASGTSLSTPLVAGAACLMVEARPSFPPQLIREALKQTASNAASPNNDYGWGIIDVEAALNWGADFLADTTIGDAPLTVQFTSLSTLNPTEWLWDFGDGETSGEENPEHLYVLPGSYSVSLTITTQYGPITSQKNNYVVAMGDTLSFPADSAFAGKTIDLPVSLRNSQRLNRIIVPFDLPETPFPVTFDTALRGSRTSHFENIRLLAQDAGNQRWVVELVADDGGGAEPLMPGSGEIMLLRLRLDYFALGGLTGTVTSSPVATYTASLESDIMSYEPTVVSGSVGTKYTQRCDVDYSNDGIIDIGDITSLIAYMFMLTYTPPSLHLSDCDNSLSTDMSDINFLIAYLFMGGPAPDSP